MTIKQLMDILAQTVKCHKEALEFFKDAPDINKAYVRGQINAYEHVSIYLNEMVKLRR